MTTVEPGRTFSSFFEEERTPLTRVLFLLTGDLEEAEEIGRDAFLMLWARWDRVAPMADPAGYLYRTALLRERSLVRRAGRRAKRPLGRGSGGYRLAARDETDRTARALESLGARTRQAVVLTGLLGGSIDEVAAVMGLRPESVRRLAAEGRATLEEGERDVGAAPLRDRLERLAERTSHHEPHVAFERMRAARRRRTRGRRITAVATVLVLVLGVTGTVVRALDRTRSTAGATPRPSGTPAASAWAEPSVLTVWPENALRGDPADQVQAAADRGAVDLGWRTDPGRVAQRFGLVVLGWSNVQLAPPESPEPDGSELWRIRPRCDADEEGVSEGDCGFAEVLTVRVVQPARAGEGGIWSVAEARSPDLAIGVGAGAIVPGGTDVAFDLDVAADRRVHAGLAATNGCREVTELEPGQEAGTFELAVPDADDETAPGCPSIGAGYVFAYVQDAITVPVGDPLLEAASIEFPWLTILPVRLEMQGAAAYPGTLLVDCGAGTETSVPFGIVTAQPDGVHVRVTASAEAVEVVFSSGERHVVTGGLGDVVLDLPPGRRGVRCVAPEADGAGILTVFDVVDPAGFWVDPALSCDRPRQTAVEVDPLVGADVDAEMRRYARRALSDDPVRAPFASVRALGYPARTNERLYGSLTSAGVEGLVRFERGAFGWRPVEVVTC